MIPIFDLDDTLYPERSFVESGFREVATMLARRFGWQAEESFRHMLDTLTREGRGAVFNRLLSAHDALNATRLRECINTYRKHFPDIKLAPEACRALDNLQVRPYLVTDGNKVVQKNKVDALFILPRFEKVFITHRHGIIHAKPSTYCFELIRKREICDWGEMFYVGDNPAKDFVNLNLLGVHTIRVKTGEYAKVIAKPGYAAKYEINSLDELENVIKEIWP